MYLLIWGQGASEGKSRHNTALSLADPTHGNTSELAGERKLLIFSLVFLSKSYFERGQTIEIFMGGRDKL